MKIMVMRSNGIIERDSDADDAVSILCTAEAHSVDFASRSGSELVLQIKLQADEGS